ncbi:MAG: DUF29 domain-containing protein [Candidatus Competibacteraceae bacterium]|nr:DUF29 domain-containing protein [Candidatus Competibacteraceae bacterium]
MNTAIYETDFYLWTQQQADLLRQGALSALDTEHLIEEVESMGRRDRNALRSYLLNVTMHLLKWRYQPERQGTSWRLSIANGRDQITWQIKDSPSLRPQLAGLLTEIYPSARRKAAGETSLPLTAFPEQCPFTVEEITGDYWPD